MVTLREMGCQSFESEEMIRTVRGKEETFVDGCGDQFKDAITLIASFLSVA
jgi:hypothetical protein